MTTADKVILLKIQADDKYMRGSTFVKDKSRLTFYFCTNTTGLKVRLFVISTAQWLRCFIRKNAAFPSAAYFFSRMLGVM